MHGSVITSGCCGAQIGPLQITVPLNRTASPYKTRSPTNSRDGHRARGHDKWDTVSSSFHSHLSAN